MSGWALGGCSGLPPAIATGTGVEPTPDGLYPLVHSGFAHAWMRPGASFAEYDQVLVHSGEITYRRPPKSSRVRARGFSGDNYALPPEMKKNLEESFRRSLEAELPRPREAGIEEESRGGTLLVRAILGDLVLHASLDALGGDNLIWMDSVGEVTLLIELYDAETRELVGRLLERRALDSGWDRPVRATVGSASFEAHRIFQDWAKRLASLLDVMRDVDLSAWNRASPQGSLA